jgi:hypothetical protein
MNKYIYAVMLITISITAAQAQRMLPKQKGLEINAGALPGKDPRQHYSLNIGLTVNGKNGSYQLWALEYTHRYAVYKGLIPQETFTAEAGYSFRLLGDARKNFNLNTALIAVAGYETINRGTGVLNDGATILNKDNFIYGAGGRLSLETYLSDRLVFLVQGKVKALWGTSLDQLRPSAGIGVRFNF